MRRLGQTSILRTEKGGTKTKGRDRRSCSFSCVDENTLNHQRVNQSVFTNDYSSCTSRDSDSNNGSIPIKRHRPFSFYRITSANRNTFSSKESSIPMKPPCCLSNKAAMNVYKKIVNSAVWNYLVIACTVVLLLGGSIQWYFKYETKTYFDIVYIATMIILLADMFLTAQTEKDYFRCYWNSRSDFAFGSFIFCFDFLSVMTLLYSISYIDPCWTNPTILTIHVSDSVALNMDDTVEGPWRIDWAIIVAVMLRITRVARFFEIAGVLNLSSKICDFFCQLTDKRKFLPSVKSFLLCGRRDGTRNMGMQQNIGIGDKDDIRFIGSHDVIAAIQIQRAWRNYFHHHETQLAITERNYNQKQKDRLDRLKKHSRQAFRGSRTRKCDTKSPGRRRSRRMKASQIGLAMNVIVTKRVAYGIVLAMILSSTFSPHETEMSMPSIMVSLHGSMILLTKNAMEKSDRSIFDSGAEFFATIAFQTTAKNLLSLTHYDGTGNYSFETNFTKLNFKEIDEVLTINVVDGNFTTTGIFHTYGTQRAIGTASILLLLFEILLWFLCLLCFGAPVTTLVVAPIERMIRLLNMLVRDPLGFDTTKRYKLLASEEDELASRTQFTNANLKGMETSFLMSTILRIGSLMKVGFGAAGVEIIRSSLGKSSGSSIAFRNHHRASTVSCIFLFCDIRQFTDASECLQEEVFLFTNKIAEVIHSVCHSLGGFANKNIGDAFLLHWKLEESTDQSSRLGSSGLTAEKNQADKALLSVVHICIALCNEEFFLEDISADAQNGLKAKFDKRPGNLVQLGFGLHAGKAVEGAIGSPRKLDATYLSNEVELAEFLESSTKKYGTSVLMSGTFFRLLHLSNQRRCRQIDEAFFEQDYDQDDFFDVPEEESESFMQIYTFDIDLEPIRHLNDNTDLESVHSSISGIPEDVLSNSISGSSNLFSSFRRKKFRPFENSSFHSIHIEMLLENNPITLEKKGFSLPKGKIHYRSSLWKDELVTSIRQRCTYKFLEKFKTGFDAYLEGNWVVAKSNFDFMVKVFDDKPSKILLLKMEQTNYRPPRNFRYRLGVVVAN